MRLACMMTLIKNHQAEVRGLHFFLSQLIKDLPSSAHRDVVMLLERISHQIRAVALVDIHLQHKYGTAQFQGNSAPSSNFILL